MSRGAFYPPFDDSGVEQPLDALREQGAHERHACALAAGQRVRALEELLADAHAREQRRANVKADEAGSAGYENSHIANE